MFLIFLLLLIIPAQVFAQYTYPYTFDGNNSLTIISTGNVGIGSVTPSTALDVNGTIRMIGFNIVSGAGANKVLTSDASGNGTWATASGGSSQWTTANTNDVYLPTNGNVGLGTTITTGGALVVVNGNVGIGTWNPVNILAVKGGVSIGTTAGTVAPSNGLIVSGNVGIGTVLTPNLLEVKGNIHIGGSSSMFWTDDSGMGITPSASTSAAMQFKTGSNIRMIINGTNVGIGTTVPLAKFAVLGNVGIGTVAGDSYLATVPPTGGLIMYGNLGVGTITPAQQLEVKGSMKFSTSLLNTTSSTGIGWSEHNAANQACNTTCGSSACVIGLDAGTVGVLNSNFVACSDATADDCLCAGP